MRREIFSSLASNREAQARLALGQITFPEHPHDPLKLMPESLCILGEAKSSHRQSLSVPGTCSAHLDVLYSDPHLDPAEIQRIVWRAIRDCLGDENFSLTLEQDRVLPYTKPWLEDPNHVFVRRCLEFGGQAYGSAVQCRAARGVADESILVHAKHIPAVCFPPEGEDEHVRDECVRISSIAKRVVPFLRSVAAYDGALAP